MFSNVQVLELTGYKITHGADFKMFSVLAALSQRITMLEYGLVSINFIQYFVTSKGHNQSQCHKYEIKFNWIMRKVIM